jgi:hypothetical protein
MPGDTDFLLFPGTKAGEPMSLNNHARIIHKIFDMIEIDPPKVTHEFRVLAAQALHDMGVSLEVRGLRPTMATSQCLGMSATHTSTSAVAVTVHASGLNTLPRLHPNLLPDAVPCHEFV